MAILVVTIVWFSSSEHKSNTDTVRVGVITPLTGQYAMFGEVNRNAAMLAANDFKQSGVEVYVEDDAYDVKKAISAYQKLKATHDINAVIVLGAPSIQAIKPLADKDNIPLLGLGVTLVYENDSVFQMMPSGDSVMPKQGELYSKQYNNIYVAHSSAELFKKSANGFIKGLEASDLLGVTEIPASSDYRTEVAHILRNNPDIVFASFPMEEGVKFIKVLNALDTSRKVKIGCDFQAALSLEKYVEAGGMDRFNNCILVQNSESANPEFKKRYEDTYGTKLVLTGDFTYDAIGMLVSLSKKNDPNQWIKELSSERFTYPSHGEFSASGKVRFNSDGTRLDEKLEVKILKDGKFVAVE